MYSCFYCGFTDSGCIEPRVRDLMLSRLLTTSAVLPKVGSIILIAHITPIWPPSSPR